MKPFIAILMLIAAIVGSVSFLAMTVRREKQQDGYLTVLAVVMVFAVLHWLIDDD